MDQRMTPPEKTAGQEDQATVSQENPSPVAPTSPERGRRATPLRVARWIARHELWLLAAATPFLLFPNRWTPLAFTLIPLTWLCRRAACGRLTLRTAMDIPMAVLVLMALVSFSISVDPAVSRAKLWGILLQAALFYGMVNGLRREGQVLRMAAILVGVTLGVALVSLVGVDWDRVRLVDLPLIYDRLPRLIRGVPGSGVPQASDLFHPREVGATLAMLLPVPIAWLLFGQRRALKLLSAAALAVGGVVLLLVQSLQALWGLGLGLLLIAAWRSRWALLSLPAGTLALAGGLLAYGPERAASALLSLDTPLGIGVVLRLDMWSRALAMIHDMPYTGIGLNTFFVIQTQFYPGVLLGPEVHAHNLFLQTAIDLGLPGLGALLWLLGAFYLTLVRAYRATSDRDLSVLLVGLAAGVLAYVGHGLLDTVTLGAKPVAALFAMLGMAAALLRREGQESTSSSPAPLSAVRRARPVAWLLALVVLSALVAPGAPSLNLGLIQAHQGLLQAQTTHAPPREALQVAATHLRQALRWDPHNSHTNYILGRLYGWLGEYEQSLEAFRQGVELDGEDPLARYAPWESYLRRLRGETDYDRWDEAIRIYSHWMVRFPERAESYVQIALVWAQHKGDPARARAVLRSGLGKAEPSGLLEYYLWALRPATGAR